MNVLRSASVGRQYRQLLVGGRSCASISVLDAHWRHRGSRPPTRVLDCGTRVIEAVIRIATPDHATAARLAAAVECRTQSVVAHKQRACSCWMPPEQAADNCQAAGHPGDGRLLSSARKTENSIVKAALCTDQAMTAVSSQFHGSNIQSVPWIIAGEKLPDLGTADELEPDVRCKINRISARLPMRLLSAWVGPGCQCMGTLAHQVALRESVSVECTTPPAFSTMSAPKFDNLGYNNAR